MKHVSFPLSLGIFIFQQLKEGPLLLKTLRLPGKKLQNATKEIPFICISKLLNQQIELMININNEMPQNKQSKNSTKRTI